MNSAKKDNWPNRKPINLFENTYRMGSLVFGGGHVLMPMMYEQFSVRPEAIKKKNPNVVQIDKEDMYTGWESCGLFRDRFFPLLLLREAWRLKDMGTEMQVHGLSDRNDRYFSSQCIVGVILFSYLE